MDPQMPAHPRTELMLPHNRKALGLDTQTVLVDRKTVQTQLLFSQETDIPTSTFGGHTYNVISPQEKASAYTVLEQVGKGSQAELLLARDPEGRTVVLKRIISALDQDAVNRFEYEIEVNRAICPYAPRITDAGLFSGRPFFARQFIDGFTLDQFAQHKPPKEGIRGLTRVCETLYQAHELGHLHGDVKGDNILIDPSGNGWLIDWGIAVSRDTPIDLVGGTYNYIAPEQFKGQPLPQSDIYSFGLVLYELVTGNPGRDLAHKNNRERARIILDADKPDLRELDDALSSIISLCLHKEPTHRYPNALELKNDLDWYANNS